MRYPKNNHCCGCGVLKSDENTSRKQNKELFESYCRPCKNIQTRERWKKNPTYFRDNQRKNKYGLGEGEVEFMLLKQKHQCAICGCKEQDLTKYGWCVDHCHTSGVVRGMLCSRCNSVLGYARDNIQTLQNAIKYLEENRWAEQKSNVPDVQLKEKTPATITCTDTTTTLPIATPVAITNLLTVLRENT